MLLKHHIKGQIEAGVDEAGRGCLVGPVFAAAVICGPKFKHKELDDSKKLNAAKRNDLRKYIEDHALDFKVSSCNHEVIDQINILNASILAMHQALAGLKLCPEFILVDGNRFKPFQNIAHLTVVKGDGKYQSIAAASILAKTYRDEFMEKMHEEFPEYDWINNKGYGTKNHVELLKKFGMSPIHRKSFKLKSEQLELF